MFIRGGMVRGSFVYDRPVYGKRRVKMKISKKNTILVSSMLFSLFFGAGNLIFPPFLGQSAGRETPIAMLGFLVTAVVLPVLGVIVVARFDGLDKLSGNVGPRFGQFYTVLIYLSIGPCLAIPRAASVPFEMAFAPYLPEGSNTTLWMLLYSLVFFAVSLWLCLTPSKLVDRLGKYLTPALLILIVVLFVGFLFRGETNIAAATESYADSPFLVGFAEGYNTMDAIAALNFGLVIATTFTSFGMSEKKDVMRHTVRTGIYAGVILALVYIMLAYMGMCSSGVYELPENGALILRAIAYQVFGAPGAILLAAIFTLACLTTCVGLINSIALYFSTLFTRLSYRAWVYVITAFSFLVCNLGLNAILSISVPILNAIYPMSIVLIVLGLTHKLWQGNRYIYPCVIGGVAVISVIHALDSAGVPELLAKYLPLYSSGYGWLLVAAGMLIIALVLGRLSAKKK